jgi:serine protease
MLAMKRLLLVGLFLVGMIWALLSYPGLANQGTYDSIVLDFRETLGQEQIQQEVAAIANQYGIAPHLNSAFSTADHVYVLPGDKNLLKALRRSPLRQYTESIDPNYIYSASAIPNDPDYSKQWNLRSINIESAWNEAKGSGVTVAVIDTGISKVPDFNQTKFVEG